MRAPSWVCVRARACAWCMRVHVCACVRARVRVCVFSLLCRHLLPLFFLSPTYNAQPSYGPVSSHFVFSLAKLLAITETMLVVRTFSAKHHSTTQLQLIKVRNKHFRLRLRYFCVSWNGF